MAKYTTKTKTLADLTVVELERALEIKQQIEELNEEMDEILFEGGEVGTQTSYPNREKFTGKGGTAAGQPWTGAQRRNYERTMRERARQQAALEEA